MTRSSRLRRRLIAVAALSLAAAGVAVAAPVTAGAAPPLSAPANDDEGGTDTLRKQLEDSSRGYLEAQEKLDASKKRQSEIAAHLKDVDADLATRSAAMGDVVDTAYRTGRAGPMSALLGADTPGAFLDRASSLQVVAAKKDKAIRQLAEAKESEQRARQALDVEITDQQKQVTVMAARKQQAETSLKAAQVGGEPAAAPGGGGGGSAASKSAPRNPDGSLPNESCSINDPTTTGCITPRTLFAMNQAKSAGFSHFVSCFRPQGSGEHPKGRACDFAAAPKTFGGVASGSDKEYGNNLANYFIDNSNRLGVLYVIWFKRIWLPGSGWRAYTRGQGDPSSDHTNHVHLSMR